MATKSGHRRRRHHPSPHNFSSFRLRFSLQPPYNIIAARGSAGACRGVTSSSLGRPVAKWRCTILQLAAIVILSLHQSAPALVVQHSRHASMPDKPVRACAQRRGCCRHKVAHRLPLVGDGEVLNSTTYRWHLRTSWLLASDLAPHSWPTSLHPAETVICTGRLQFAPHIESACCHIF